MNPQKDQQTIQLLQKQLDKEKMRSQAMRDNLKRRKVYQMALKNAEKNLVQEQISELITPNHVMKDE